MTKKQFKPVDPRVNFPKMEEGILDYWEKNNIFAKSLEKTKGGKSFVFYEGPPTANGKPGIHHVESRSFKDIIPRYKTMRGYHCDRKAGWDCHGLPVELEVEKKLGISGKPQIEEHGVEDFNKLCRKSVFEYVEEWEKVTKRVGYWVDLKNAYETMDNNYIESSWWLIKQMADKGRLYEDYKVVPYCPRCGTSLSSHELALGYKDDIADPSLFIKFPVKGEDNTYFLAWTTTPWTLPGNVALAVDEREKYIKVEVDGEYLILAKKRIEVLDEKCKTVKEFSGNELLNMEYEPLFAFVKHAKKAHYVVPADFVSMDEGTGIVHTAVMYGEDDFELGKKFDLPRHHVVNEKGEFTDEVTPWKGMFVKDADKEIIDYLSEKGLLYKADQILHTYPFCWRCNTPLLYYALTSWYLKTTDVKGELIKNNRSVNWIPEHIKEGRMGEWLKNNKDWALSRSRYWGTPLPVWKCDTCSEVKVVGSVEELSKLSGKNQKELDLHKPDIDEVTWKCASCEGTMTRVPFVLDCWFDSGAMPYGQWHYPFENKDKFEKNFPADYISEAIDQTRGWFYTLQAVSTLMDMGTPYKNVICLGHILDEKGNKMSKSKGNVVNPWDIFNEVGADAARWYFFSAIAPGPSFRFSANLVRDVVKKLMLPLWNSYNFFVTYANLSGWKPAKTEKYTVLDKWILARLKELVTQVTENLDNYDIYTSTHLIEDFVLKDFSQWYIRRSRKNINPGFFATTWKVLVEVSKLMAPFAPFISEELYRNLTGEESVHLADWPKVEKLTKEEKDVLSQMAEVRVIVERAHALRKEAGIPVRQPLAHLAIYNTKNILDDFLGLVAEEVNVKEIYAKATGEGELKVELDTAMSPQLRAEGEARDLVRKIQEARKEAKTALDEQVIVYLPSWPKDFEDEIKKRALVSELRQGDFKLVREK